ncbi:MULTISPECIES: hypothetical protein [unclassified Micromonospora]|uniref:hypothetical protein n=1 Tax=unclassified Micromonospora TaxID=2617518 RepID=UPI001C21EFA6|nr:MULTISPECIES: hypothetical protein [unclassified Micromonospora]MBU8858606.1 hypothetical protein [Micromonospora sp. WMMB482]MDM4784250.1 hypothetical protein [Micromonospora sp. b486]
MTSRAPSPVRREPVPVPLTEHFDNVGFTQPDQLSSGAFNIWGNTFPADELPPGPEVRLDGVPFLIPAAPVGSPDNLRCAGQLVAVPPGRYDWVRLLCAAERRTEDRVWLHYTDGTIDPEWLRVSDFWPETAPRFGESLAFRFSRMHYPRHVDRRMKPAIWSQRLPITRAAELAAVRLPDNPAIHLFAMTLVPPSDGEER